MMKAVETRRHLSLCYQRVARIQLRTVVSFVVVDSYDEKSEEPALARHHTAQPARILEHIPAACHIAERTGDSFEAGIDTNIAAADTAAAAGYLHHTTRKNTHVAHCLLLVMASSSQPLHWTMPLPQVQKQQKHEKHPVEETPRRPCSATSDTSAPGHWFRVRHPHTRRRLGAYRGIPWSSTTLQNGI